MYNKRVPRGLAWPSDGLHVLAPLCLQSPYLNSTSSPSSQSRSRINQPRDGATSRLLLSLSRRMSFITLTLMLLVVPLWMVNANDELTIDEGAIRNMARTFGRELSSVSSEQTCLARIEENFLHYSHEVSWFDGKKMMDDMRNDVINMFNWKKHSVERIANESEKLSSNHTYDKNMEIDYYNVKNLNESGTALLPLNPMDPNSKPIPLTQNRNFDYALVNLENSAIHVPINVYDKSPDVVNDIKWSEHLTQFFRNNLAFDPSLSWQFFGSAKGFLRLFPASGWREQDNYMGREQVDFYDCRMRPWYIRGAASPKDIVILLDTSGSMTGVRKSIAANVVENILDTLTDDDYVAAFRFAKKVTPLHDCFDSMVQANKKNILELKASLENVITEQFVNFTAALEEAFNLLQHINRSGKGSQCNQAIMLITDGAPANYEETFKKYNWPNIPVRVFTYLIGQDSSAQNEVYWMACHNRGYYTHVISQAEVHEQVQKYIPVMSRPIVLSGKRIFSWTPVYAPHHLLELSNTIWQNKQKYEIISKLRAEAQIASGEIKSEEDEKKKKKKRKKRQDDEQVEVERPSMFYKQVAYPARHEIHPKVPLYTTLSTPVFDTRNYTNITKRILIKNVYQDAEVETIRIANLLGVAGIDIPIREIEKLTPPFKLGVNSYAFIITNNGYLLNHPDLRPTFNGFLKPFYSSVDMSEVELANNTFGPRVPDPEIEAIRSNMIDRTHGWKKVAVKMHLDDMKRVITRVNYYTHGMIDNTPFSIAIALPEPYGSYRLTSQVDLRMKHRGENFTQFFHGNQWRLHPEWAYCVSPHQLSGVVPETYTSPEESILQFLTKDLDKTFRWQTSSMRPTVYETIVCDKDMIQSLILDANLTDIPEERCGGTPNYRDEQRVRTFGIVATFVATRSGLTRFKDYRTRDELQKLEGLPYYLEHNKAIEETYYKRAVDFYVLNKEAFLYTVDFDAGEKHEKRTQMHSHLDPNFLITATHALFIGNGKQSAPVAVLGVQFRYRNMLEFLLNTTTKFSVPCTHLDVDCYLVDNNAFVVVSNHKVNDVGRFFGEVDGDVLNALVDAAVYRRIHLYDYQAICLSNTDNSKTGFGFNVFLNSIPAQLYNLVSRFALSLATLYLHVIYGSWSIDALPLNSEPSTDYVRQENMEWATGYSVYVDPFSVNRTEVKWCDKEFDLYEMQDFSDNTFSKEVACQQNTACTRKVVSQYIQHTNLQLVVVVNNPSCDCPKTKLSIKPEEIKYKDECKLKKTEKYRKRPQNCFNYHPQEKDIRQCGGANAKSSFPLALVLVLHTLLYRFILA